MRDASRAVRWRWLCPLLLLPAGAVRIGSRGTCRQIRSRPAAISPTADDEARDPRAAPPWITENQALLDELRAASTAEPRAATASTSRHVSPIVSLEALEAAIARADAAGRLVAVKYYSPQCRSCLQIKPLYERAAEGAFGEQVDFYEVDSFCARVLCSLANMRLLPTVQVYGRGALLDARTVNNKVLYLEFEAALAKAVLSHCTFSVAGEAESDAAVAGAARPAASWPAIGGGSGAHRMAGRR
ncbi:hypothetical protein EMIHUDRAFT_106166 [Emiliania huxleyi CCMP1516]|uniref:Thioredoxin domain-containing protein n=2 Tax=Emiliania huxleyi TaxID=2903 RepID=A0A0D3IA42_EMIH1|nr:hypothetical protein EMIHUDRAFT_106166 [Emiliania huxleyi CCMP1516]EOD08127.1 hypothetical protein EMIHUDRAFT_106166 [Emiliania huxleyi CCMP1516]|eukprot:XP_005760556.1 hypothetical protein EMIHUDRAFT_106166 [Emiliania huxleyi CCMP1516]